ncbi:hypothetical protein NKG05_11325 [Oerskovia sp. M15]
MPAVLVTGLTFAGAVWALVRLLSVGLDEGVHPCAAGSHGRRGRSSDCWTPPAPCCSRSTRASSRRSGCGCWARASGATSRHPPSSCCPHSPRSTTARSWPTTRWSRPTS